MAGFTPDSGEALAANIVIKRVLTDRDADLELGLFTAPNPPTETTVLGDLTEPSGGGYARKTLTDASWTGTGDTRSYAEQTFTPSGASWTDVRGYFIATKASGGTPRLLFIEVDSNGPYTIADGASYKVTPNVTVA